MNVLFAPRLIRRCLQCWLLSVATSAFAQFHIVWGDMHGHTKLSDGKGSVDDYFIYARDVAKLDFVIVTDHDFGNEAPWRMPTADWTLIQQKADEYTVKDHFVGIAGYEWTSQPKYWTEWKKGTDGVVSERLFSGPPKFYNHKNVYFPDKLDYLFSAKDAAYNCPDLLAEAVGKAGGLIHNAHPAADEEGRDQFDYTSAHASVIANTEMWPDTILYEGKTFEMRCEQTVRAFLNRGGKTGFVAGTDSHEGKTAARTAVLVRELTPAAIFDALRHRRNYAINNARIGLDFRINNHVMGEAIEAKGKPRILVSVKGTAPIEEIIIIRDGAVIHSASPRKEKVTLTYVDRTFRGPSYYYVRVIQSDTDPHGNLSHAWSSPIWVRQRL